MSEQETLSTSEQAKKEAPRDWHRLLSAFLRDWLSGQPVTVQSEYDLSVQKQLLDVLIVRQDSGPMTVRLPDGFEDLGKYNLITFKSHQESLTGKSMDELVSHFITFQKIVSDRNKDLPDDDFRLFALTVKFPRKLAKELKFEEIRKGVYSVSTFSKKEIRIVVVHQLPLKKRNALAHLFSAKKKAITFAQKHYAVQSEMSSSLLSQLLGQYSKEGIDMPFDLDKWLAEKQMEMFRDTLKKLKPEDLAKILKPEERVAGLKPEERVAGLKPEDRIIGMSPEEKEALRKLLDTERTDPNPK